MNSGNRTNVNVHFLVLVMYCSYICHHWRPGKSTGNSTVFTTSCIYNYFQIKVKKNKKGSIYFKVYIIDPIYFADYILFLTEAEL